MADRRGRARARSGALLIAGLAAAALAACAATPSGAPGVSATAIPSTTVATTSPTESAPSPTGAATPAPISTSEATACATTDLKASHDLVEGAAGSRMTTVVLVSARACSVDLSPTMAVRDADGKELVASTATSPGRIDLAAGVGYSSDVRLANWCSPAPKFPLSLVLRIGTDDVGVTGSSFPESGDMPPCNGGGGPELEAAPWEVAP